MSGVEKKYNQLRSQLDKFGYKAPLGVESIPLIQRLFGDLVHTTESLKKARLRVRVIQLYWSLVTNIFSGTHRRRLES